MRVADLRAEIEEAEEFADSGRAARLRAELDQLVDQLASRYGSHGRTRGPAETARKAATKVLRTQIGKLFDLHPALGRHLRDTVRMGTVCVYAPPAPIDWDVRFGPGELCAEPCDPQDSAGTTAVATRYPKGSAFRSTEVRPFAGCLR